MNRLFFSLSLVCLSLAACSNEPKKGDTLSGIQKTEADSIKANEIDTLAEHINRQWRRDSNAFHILPINQRDTIQFTEINGEPQRISSMFFTDTTLTWVVFHQINNELKLVRFREKRDTPKTTVKEAISYLANGKIFYSKERSKELAPGEAMSIFRLLTFVENARTPAEMEAEYAPYWEVTKKAITEYKAAKK